MAPIVRVRHFENHSEVQSSTIAVTVPATIPVGNTLLLAALRTDVSGNSGGITSIVDSGGNTWAGPDAFSLQANKCMLALYRCRVTTQLNAGDTITVTFAGTTINRKAVGVSEYSGLIASPLDQHSSQTITNNPTSTGVTGSNSPLSASTPGATAQANELIFGAFGSSVADFTEGSGFTVDTELGTTGGSADRQLSTEWRVASTVGVKTADGTSTGPGTWAAVIATYKGDVLNPPTVSAGPDLTKDISAGNFNITGTATPDTGATIVSRSWTQVSGPAVTLANATTATVTVTPPGAAGTAVLRFSATDSNGLTTTDDVTITFIVAGQALRPVGDVAKGAWTATPSTSNFYANIDEATLDTSDYLQSSDTPTNDEYKCRLTPRPAPASTSGTYIEACLDVLPGTTSHSVVVTLYDSDGTTVRKSVTITDLTTSPVVRQINLTSGEAAAITGWTAGIVGGVKATAS